MEVLDTISNFLEDVEDATNPRFRYPISHQSEYKGTIKFTALKADYQTLGSKIIGTANAGGATNALTDILEGIEELVDFFDDLEALLGGNFRTLNYDGVSHDPAGSVTLHLPTSLSYVDKIDYPGAQFGAMGMAAERLFRSGGVDVGAVAKEAGRQVGSTVESVIDAFKGTIESETAALYAQRAIGKFSEPVTGALEVTQGITLNPNRRSLLRGVAIRNFSFNFKLIPNDQKESEEIKKIIQFFRKNMYPEDIREDTTGISIGYRYPNKFLIEMMYDGEPIASKILYCFLEGFNTNYNPNSMSFHKDGEFPEIDIALTFVEERALRRQDIVKGY